MRSWSYWSRIKSFGENNQPSIKDNEVLEVKPGVQKWVKGGLKGYKKSTLARGSYHKDKEAGRDCITRAVGNT